MDRLYQTVAGQRHTIGPHTYEQLDGADRILRDYLEHTLQQLPPWERRLVRSILKQFVQSSELKAVRSVERIASEVGQTEETVERILARLEDLRLVRRVGRPERRQYEVVHEYMARKIEEWMTERQIEVKDVQDLLTRELGNYQKFGLLMQEGALRVLSMHRNELTISPEEMALIIRSAVHRQVDVGYWLGRVEELEEFLEPTIRDAAGQAAHVCRRRCGRWWRTPARVLQRARGPPDDEAEDAGSGGIPARLDRDLVHLLGRGTDEERHPPPTPSAHRESVGAAPARQAARRRRGDA